MTRNEAYLTVVEGWLRDNRGIVFTEGAVDDLCDRIAVEVERLRERYEFQVDANRSLVEACAKSETDNARHMREKVALAGLVTKERDSNERLRKIIGYLEDHADIPISVRQDARRTLEPE